MHPLPIALSVTTEEAAHNPQQRRRQPLHQQGHEFVPYRVFSAGVFVPDPILASAQLSFGAKFLWARLARYAGADGACFPSLAKLAADLGCSTRQIQRYLAELVRGRYIRAKQRGFNQSNAYAFLWHPDFEESECELGHGATSVSCPLSATKVSPCLSATQVTPLRETAKSKNQTQAERAHVCVQGDSKDPACTSPDAAEPTNPIPRDEAVLKELRRFQHDMELSGTPDITTARAILAIIPPEEVHQALRFVAEKLRVRRQRSLEYRTRVDFGFVLTVLRQDYRKPDQDGKPPGPDRRGIALALPVSAAMSGSLNIKESNDKPRNGLRAGLSRAGDIMRASERLRADLQASHE